MIKTGITPEIAREAVRYGADLTYGGAPVEVRKVDPTQANILVCMRILAPFGAEHPAPVPSLRRRCLRCSCEIWVSLVAPRDVHYLCEVCFGRIAAPWNRVPDDPNAKICGADDGSTVCILPTGHPLGHKAEGGRVWL